MTVDNESKVGLAIVGDVGNNLSIASVCIILFVVVFLLLCSVLKSNSIDPIQLFFLIIIMVLLLGIILFLIASYCVDENWKALPDFSQESSTRASPMKTLNPITLPSNTASDAEMSIQKIPKVIYQTNNRLNVPIGMYKSIQSWIDKNPEYEHRYYTTEACRAFIEAHFDSDTLEAYDTLIPGAYKADLWRYCVLYENGGVYADSAMVNLIPLSKLIQTDDEFISPIDYSYHGGIYNAFIACIPKHPILKKVIHLVVERIKKRDYGHRDLYITGPIALGDSINEILNRKHLSPFKPKIYIHNGMKFRLISHHRVLFKKTGYITYKKNKFILTKYIGANKEKSVWTKQDSYGTLWNKKKVFRTKEDLKAQRLKNITKHKR